jgi:phosphoribosylformylglycinamidine synthase subunit PurS
MRYRVEVFVTLKPVVNDPAGLTIRGGLHALGFDSVAEVRSGKYLVLTLDEPDAAQARARVDDMARQLLANAVIEDYRMELQVESPSPVVAAAGPSAHASGASVPSERLRRSVRGGGS